MKVGFCAAWRLALVGCTQISQPQPSRAGHLGMVGLLVCIYDNVRKVEKRS
ncbi:hypothetical protein FOTG_17455 [Fusarium oxysporum f. sp. vasinfectum 25433]|uniref:Uncharacterized protein n=1 Tax=Fusarium oxysporum f. sp. vasinfectum 25433 TaxID=1089449 RepID=X0KZ97_FUSOX|nr:hypothetical protein FOTG_17455 [Fusarium oxysporum f. sp. vasinfectum 25433]